MITYHTSTTVITADEQVTAASSSVYTGVIFVYVPMCLLVDRILMYVPVYQCMYGGTCTGSLLVQYLEVQTPLNFSSVCPQHMNVVLQDHSNVNHSSHNKHQ